MLIRSIALCLAALLAGCANNAKITYAWMAEDISERERSGVLVLAISKKAEPRKRFEQAFTDALVRHEVRAVASYTVNPKLKITREDVEAMAEKAGVDTVLVTTFAGRDQYEVLHPGRTYYGVVPVYSPTGGYYGRGGVYGAPFEVAHVPDFYAQHKSIHLEANLYDVKTAEHLWQAAAGVEDSGDNRALVEQFIDAFIKQLQQDQLVR